MIHRLPDDLVRHIARALACASPSRMDASQTAARVAAAGWIDLAQALWHTLDPGCQHTGPARRPWCWVRLAARRAIRADAARVLDPRRLVVAHGLRAADVAPWLKHGEQGLRRCFLADALRRAELRGTSARAPVCAEIHAVRHLIFQRLVPPELRASSWIVMDCERAYVRTQSRVAFTLAKRLTDRYLRVLLAAEAEGLGARRDEIAELVVVDDLSVDQALNVLRDAHVA